MKVVVNRCFGGFGVSTKALKELIALGSPGVETWEDKPESGWHSLGAEHEVDAGDGYRAARFTGVLFKDGKVYSFSRDDKFRSDPALVSVVERLGREADGQHAKLEVVDVPDDVPWHIDEYDGQERVAENHRSW